MKRNFEQAILFAIVLLMASTSVNAKSWRIHHNPNVKANFVDINAAMASEDVAAGDTLYMDPGCTLSSTQTITKQVVVVGTGYHFTDQPHQQAMISATLKIQSANTKIEGLYIKGETSIQANYVTLERCRGYQVTSGGSSCTNATIRQCYLEDKIEGRGKTSTQSANWLIENCYVGFWRGGSHIGDSSIQNLFSVTLKNNFIRQTSTSTSYATSGCVLGDCDNITLTNNVLIAARPERIFGSCANYTCTGNLFSCAETVLPACTESNAFLNSNDPNLVFSAGQGDRWLELREDSPAKGIGVGGIDAGPRAGLYPYVFSGYPVGRPYFKAAEVSPMAKDGKISVKLNVKMQDE